MSRAERLNLLPGYKLYARRIELLLLVWAAGNNEPVNTFEGAMAGAARRTLIISSRIPVPRSHCNPLTRLEFDAAIFQRRFGSALFNNTQFVNRLKGAVTATPINHEKGGHPNGFLCSVFQADRNMVAPHISVFVRLNHHRQNLVSGRSCSGQETQGYKTT